MPSGIRVNLTSSRCSSNKQVALGFSAQTFAVPMPPWTLLVLRATRVLFLYARSISADKIMAVVKTMTREAGLRADEGHPLLSGCSYPPISSIKYGITHDEV